MVVEGRTFLDGGGSGRDIGAAPPLLSARVFGRGHGAYGVLSSQMEQDRLSALRVQFHGQILLQGWSRFRIRDFKISDFKKVLKVVKRFKHTVSNLVVQMKS